MRPPKKLTAEGAEDAESKNLQRKTPRSLRSAVKKAFFRRLNNEFPEKMHRRRDAEGFISDNSAPLRYLFSGESIITTTV
jgi:hypothetical protein